MMDFQTAVQTCLRKYVDFSGRASRSEFWWFALAQLVVLFSANLIHDFVGFIVGLALLLPSLSAGARRLHDVDKSGWFQLLLIIPLINLVVIFFWVGRSQPEANSYGEPPSV